VKQDGAVAQNKVRWTRKAADWLRKGAQPSNTVRQLFVKAGIATT